MDWIQNLEREGSDHSQAFGLINLADGCDSY